jgi:hypothetical protein
MDVLNRKLFANKEARNKLAEMGGIMASSEALMREAQNVPMYAPGGVVDAPQRQPQFVITIPGYRNGAMLRINESTLMMMNDTIPDLMSQEGTQVFPVEMFGDSDAALKIRPGDAIINADLNPRQEQVALPEQSVSRKQTVLERKGLESMFGGPDLSNYTGERTTFSDVMTNPAYDASLDNTQAIVPETPFALNSYMESMFPDGESNPMYPGGQPIADAKLRDVQGPPTAPTESYVPPERKKGPAFSAFGMPPPADYQTTFPISSQEIDDDNLATEQNSTKKRVEQIDSGISAIETELAKDPFNADIKRRLEEAKRQRDAAVKAQQEAITASVKPKSGGTGVGREDGPGKPVPAPEILATSVADAFAKLGDPAAASKAVLGKILADKAGPEGKEPPPSVDNMDIKTRVKTYENLFKEMFDEKDEDKTKEMYLNLAMIGFAVASGTSSNALTNISQGLMQGVTKMNEDRATRTARSDKVKMLALSESLTDERDDKSFDQQLQLAGIKNKGDRQEYLYKSVFETTYKTALEDDPENQQGALDQATRAAVSAAPEAPSALIAVKSTDNGTGGGTPTQKYAVGQVYKIGGKDYTYTGDRTKGNQGFVPN